MAIIDADATQRMNKYYYKASPSAGWEKDRAMKLELLPIDFLCLSSKLRSVGAYMDKQWSV